MNYKSVNAMSASEVRYIRITNQLMLCLLVKLGI